MKFNTDHFILGNAYHCVMALRNYPTTTEELALLGHLGERSGVNLTISCRHILLVVHCQQPHEVLPAGLAHPETMVTDAPLQPDHLTAGVVLLLAVQLEDQGSSWE